MPPIFDLKNLGTGKYLPGGADDDALEQGTHTDSQPADGGDHYEFTGETATASNDVTSGSEDPGCEVVFGWLGRGGLLGFGVSTR